MHAPRPIHVLLFDASLRDGSHNRKLVKLAEHVVRDLGGDARRCAMADYHCPLYHQDVEQERGIADGARRLCG